MEPYVRTGFLPICSHCLPQRVNVLLIVVLGTPLRMDHMCKDRATTMAEGEQYFGLFLHVGASTFFAG